MIQQTIKHNNYGTDNQGSPLPAVFPSGTRQFQGIQSQEGNSAQDSHKRIEWDVEKERPLLVEFSKEEMDYLKKACERISDEELPDDMWATVETVYNEIAKS